MSQLPGQMRVASYTNVAVGKLARSTTTVMSFLLPMVGHGWPQIDFQFIHEHLPTSIQQFDAAPTWPMRVSAPSWIRNALVGRSRHAPA